MSSTGQKGGSWTPPHAPAVLPTVWRAQEGTSALSPFLLLTDDGGSWVFVCAGLCLPGFWKLVSSHLAFEHSGDHTQVLEPAVLFPDPSP